MASSRVTRRRRRAGQDSTDDNDASGRPPFRRDVELLNAAAKVFSERGYAKASVQDIADELGILKGSLYHYIRVKEDLLFWLLEGVHRDVHEILIEIMEIEDMDPLERLALYVRRQVLYLLENIERVSIYYHDLEALSEDRRSDILKQRHAHEQFVSRLIEEAQEEGLAASSLEGRVLTNCLFGTIIWTYRWYKPQGLDIREQIADTIADFAIFGVVGAVPLD
jgi:AcrR family transcriptional regulator